MTHVMRDGSCIEEPHQSRDTWHHLVNAFLVNTIMHPSMRHFQHMFILSFIFFTSSNITNERYSNK